MKPDPDPATRAPAIDRMEIEETGPNPEKLAAAIHHQLGNIDGPVPVDAIAGALDIVQIRSEPLNNLEGALITSPERDIGMILVNASSGRQRCRYSLSHELGHFLKGRSGRRHDTERR